jgi:hypothetical protein
MTIAGMFNPQMASAIFLVIVFITIAANLLDAKWHGFRNSLADDYRKIAAYEQLNRALTLAVEAGQQIHCSLGSGGLYGIWGGATLVGGQLLNSITRSLVHGDRPVLATSGDGMVGILAQDEQSRAYSQAGISADYLPDMSQVSGLTPWSYVAGVQSLMIDQPAAINVLVGHFGSEVGLLAEASDRNPAQMIGGSDSLTAQAVLFASTQAPIIGEELYVAGAYCRSDPWQWASLKTQDLLRWLLIGLIITGLVLKLIGVM